LLIEGDRREAVLRLDEAIGRATEGAEIRLAPGEHRLARPLEINKSLTLVGPGPDQCRVTCAGEGFVIEYSGNGTFAARGIRFEHVGSEPASVLVIASGQIDLENCVCRGAVWDNGRNIGGDGLLATGSARGIVRDCRFEQNGVHGVQLSDNAALTLEGNTWAVVLALETLSYSILKVGGDGLRATGSAKADDREITYRFGGDGLFATGSAQGTVRNCRFEHNGLHGVELTLYAALTLEGNTCQQNGQCGIAFFGNSTGQVRNNVCRNNGHDGIYAGGQSWPMLEANRCEGNKQYGILFRDNATGGARKNICTGNGRGAIFVEKTAKPELEANEGEVVYGK